MLKQVYLVARYLAVSLVWTVLATIVHWLPFQSLFRPKSWVGWGAEDLTEAWLTTTLRQGNHIGPTDVVKSFTSKVQLPSPLTSRISLEATWALSSALNWNTPRLQ